jgi:sodium/potassium-transporting ATPase subunit alpha
MVRGAPDLLLAKCKYIIKPNGGTMRLNEESRRLIEAKLNKWSLMGRRSICFCKKIIPNETAEPYAQMSKKQSQKWLNSECSELTFVGLIAFIDPPKPG